MARQNNQNNFTIIFVPAMRNVILGILGRRACASLFTASLQNAARLSMIGTSLVLYASHRHFPTL